MNNKIIIWKCLECGDVKISNPRQHHCMENCKCMDCGMDLERYMCRIAGNPKILKEIDLDKTDFYCELLKGCLEQGFFIELPVIMRLEEIEKEILMEVVSSSSK